MRRFRARVQSASPPHNPYIRMVLRDTERGRHALPATCGTRNGTARKNAYRDTARHGTREQNQTRHSNSRAAGTRHGTVSRAARHIHMRLITHGVGGDVGVAGCCADDCCCLRSRRLSESPPSAAPSALAHNEPKQHMLHGALCFYAGNDRAGIASLRARSSSVGLVKRCSAKLG